MVDLMLLVWVWLVVWVWFTLDGTIGEEGEENCIHVVIATGHGRVPVSIISGLIMSSSS